MSYDAELEFAKNLALEAGGIMRRYFRAEDIGTEWKEDNTPLTVADTTINRLVIDQVKENFPEHGVLGEEESYEPERDTIWVVDPIDGTVPFSLAIPISTFSLALVNKKDGQPVVAVTYDPWADEIFSATKGGGAFLNDKPIQTSSATDLKQAYMAISVGNIRLMEKLRDQGAHTMNIASFVYLSNRVAAGQLLAAVMKKPKAWDIAATALLIQEAGGVVTDQSGNQRRFDEMGNGAVMAANATIHRKLMEILAES